MSTVRLISSLLVVSALALPATAGAALKVLDMGVLSPVVSASGKSKVKVLVRNTGRKPVRAGVVRFRLAGKGGKALAGSAKVGRIKARSVKTATGVVAIPKGLAPGAHAIVGCLGAICAKRPE